MTNLFPTARRRPDAAVQLVCLPYAGGGASAFRRWADLVGDDIEVLPFSPPGRESRLLEDPEVDPGAVADAIAERVDRPWALYGHSLGARIGFEALRLLHARGTALPLRLYVGGARAPRVQAVDGHFDGLSGLTDTELVARLATGGGVPAAVLEHAELVELLLPALRADFTWLDEYRYRPGPTLPVPIVGFVGLADTVIPRDQVDAWEQETSAGFTCHDVDGGHFFLNDRLPHLLAPLLDDLRHAAAAHAPHGAGGPHP